MSRRYACLRWSYSQDNKYIQLFSLLTNQLSSLSAVAQRTRHCAVACFSEGCDRAKAQSGNNEWHISPTTQRAFRKTPLLPSSPVNLLSPRLALKVRWETRESTATPPPLLPPPTDWFKQALGGRGSAGCGPTEHAQWGGMPCDGNTVGSPICWCSVHFSPRALFHPV